MVIPMFELEKCQPMESLGCRPTCGVRMGQIVPSAL